jgi:DNA invertase Pin-like site-specific DNA recombinase
MVQTNSKTWGYILQGPGRPALAKQREILRALGVDVDMEYGPVWHDKLDRVVGGKSAGERQLDERNGLLKAVQEGDRVVVAAPYCLGISERDAKVFIEALAKRGVTLVVSNDAWMVSPGSDASTLLAALVRQQNTTNVAAYRRRKSS